MNVSQAAIGFMALGSTWQRVWSEIDGERSFARYLVSLQSVPKAEWEVHVEYVIISKLRYPTVCSFSSLVPVRSVGLGFLLLADLSSSMFGVIQQ